MSTITSVTVLYADHRSLAKTNERVLFEILVKADTDAIKSVFPYSYKPAFNITPMPGRSLDDICEDCFDRGNLDQPLIREAGRSMSVGDIVQLGLPDGASLYRVCASAGWTPISL